MNFDRIHKNRLIGLSCGGLVSSLILTNFGETHVSLRLWVSLIAAICSACKSKDLSDKMLARLTSFIAGCLLMKAVQLLGDQYDDDAIEQSFATEFGTTVLLLFLAFLFCFIG